MPRTRSQTRRELSQLYLDSEQYNLSQEEAKQELPTPAKAPKPPAPKPPPAPKAPSPPALGEAVVGKRILVHFGDDHWLKATITSYDPSTVRHSLDFDNFKHGKLEPVNLGDIQFEMVEHDSGETTSNGRVLFKETTTTTHWTTDTTTVKKVTRHYQDSEERPLSGER